MESVPNISCTHSHWTLDIDDTIKITNVTETLALLMNTFVLPARPVAGMPALYASLSHSLDDPEFIYLTGTPWQFYPFIRDFIATSFPTTRGPIIHNNFTVTDVTKILTDFATLDTYTYKVAQITRLHGMYPRKSFLALGDSGQTDPEVYGEMYDAALLLWYTEVSDLL